MSAKQEKKEFSSHRVFITGTNRGLGFAMMVWFLEHGHEVYSFSRKSNDAMDALKAQYPEHLFMYFGGVTNEADIQAAVKLVKQQADTLDILINNAAVRIEPAAEKLDELQFDTFGETFQVNAVAMLKVAKHVVPLLERGQQKLLVTISSEAGSIGDSTRSSEYAYCMSKAAANMAAKILHNDLREKGVKVLNIHPGWFSSDMGGTEAPIPPTQSAHMVCQTICRSWKLDDPIFVDTSGKEMNW